MSALLSQLDPWIEPTIVHAISFRPPFATAASGKTTTPRSSSSLPPPLSLAAAAVRRKPRLVQILSRYGGEWDAPPTRATVEPQHQTDRYLVVHDGHHSIAAHLDARCLPSSSIQQASLRKGALVVLQEWNVDVVHGPPVHSRDDGDDRRIAGLTVKRIKLIGGENMGVIGDPYDVFKSIDVRREMRSIEGAAGQPPQLLLQKRIDACESYFRRLDEYEKEEKQTNRGNGAAGDFAKESARRPGISGGTQRRAESSSGGAQPPRQRIGNVEELFRRQREQRQRQIESREQQQQPSSRNARAQPHQPQQAAAAQRPPQPPQQAAVPITTPTATASATGEGPETAGVEGVQALFGRVLRHAAATKNQQKAREDQQKQQQQQKPTTGSGGREAEASLPSSDADVQALFGRVLRHAKATQQQRALGGTVPPAMPLTTTTIAPAPAGTAQSSSSRTVEQLIAAPHAQAAIAPEAAAAPPATLMVPAAESGATAAASAAAPAVAAPVAAGAEEENVQALFGRVLRHAKATRQQQQQQRAATTSASSAGTIPTATATSPAPVERRKERSRTKIPPVGDGHKGPNVHGIRYVKLRPPSTFLRRRVYGEDCEGKMRFGTVVGCTEPIKIEKGECLWTVQYDGGGSYSESGKEYDAADLAEALRLYQMKHNDDETEKERIDRRKNDIEETSEQTGERTAAEEALVTAMVRGGVAISSPAAVAADDAQTLLDDAIRRAGSCSSSAKRRLQGRRLGAVVEEEERNANATEAGGDDVTVVAAAAAATTTGASEEAPATPVHARPSLKGRRSTPAPSPSSMAQLRPPPTPEETYRRRFDPVGTIQAANAKFDGEGDLSGARDIYESALRDRVERARAIVRESNNNVVPAAGESGGGRRRRRGSAQSRKAELSALRDAMSRLYVAYAHMNCRAGQKAHALEVYRQASECPLAKASGNMWLNYARFCWEEQQMNIAKAVFLRALVFGDKLEDGTELVTGNVPPDDEHRKRLWEDFLHFSREHSKNRMLVFDELRRHYQPSSFSSDSHRDELRDWALRLTSSLGYSSLVNDALPHLLEKEQNQKPLSFSSQWTADEGAALGKVDEEEESDVESSDSDIVGISEMLVSQEDAEAPELEKRESFSQREDFVGGECEAEENIRGYTCQKMDVDGQESQMPASPLLETQPPIGYEASSEAGRSGEVHVPRVGRVASEGALKRRNGRGSHDIEPSYQDSPEPETEPLSIPLETQPPFAQDDALRMDSQHSDAMPAILHVDDDIGPMQVLTQPPSPSGNKDVKEAQALGAFSDSIEKPEESLNAETQRSGPSNEEENAVEPIRRTSLEEEAILEDRGRSSSVQSTPGQPPTRGKTPQVRSLAKRRRPAGFALPRIIVPLQYRKRNRFFAGNGAEEDSRKKQKRNNRRGIFNISAWLNKNAR